MVLDALRGYVQLANGLTDVTRQRATQVARQLLEQGGDVVDHAVSTAVSGNVARQAQSLAEDLLATSRTNRDLLVGLVRTEVERAVGRLGLVGADELAAMVRLVERLQGQLDAAIAFGGDDARRGRGRRARADGGAGGQGPRQEGPGERGRQEDRQEGASKAPAKKVAAKKVPAKKIPAKKVPRPRSAEKVAAKKVAAKKVPARRGRARDDR